MGNVKNVFLQLSVLILQTLLRQIQHYGGLTRCHDEPKGKLNYGKAVQAKLPVLNDNYISNRI